MEIGGYLEFERYYGTEYHTRCLKLNNARNCLKYLIEARKIKKIWISRWNCSAILDTCQKSGVEMCFFDLDDSFKPILPDSYQAGDFLYVVNYYGQLIDYYKENLILDNVQAFFQKPQKGVDTLYTCRKFFGVSDGAYLYTDSILNKEIGRDDSTTRMQHLVGRLEKTGACYFDEYQKNELLFDQEPLKYMSKFTENILRSIDYESVRRRREDNFRYLNEKLHKINKLKLNCPSGPFAYPLMVQEGEKLRKILQNKKIYIAKLWPNVSAASEKRLADNILPLPCDQRYSLEQMDIMCNEIIRELG